jgi:hypothetical protein
VAIETGSPLVPCFVFGQVSSMDSQIILCFGCFISKTGMFFFIFCPSLEFTNGGSLVGSFTMSCVGIFDLLHLCFGECLGAFLLTSA